MIEIAEATRGVGLLPGPGTELTVRQLDGALTEVTAAAADGLPGVRVEVDLGAAAGYWHPASRGQRTLPPDWADPTVTSLVSSAPVGTLYDASGHVLLGWAASETTAELLVRIGVSEERNSFVVEVRPLFPIDGDLVLVLDRSRGRLVATVQRLAAWLSTRCTDRPLVPPTICREPAYSTWYAFTQDINDAALLTEAKIAVDLGCGSVFIDDGWQQHGHSRGYQGCGDWLPDTAKFPNLADTIQAVHGLGVGAALWIAPLLLGAESQVFDSLGRFAPTHSDLLNCSVLDPRHGEVREFVADTCLRLVRDYDVDLLKVDFLDQAMVYRGSLGSGDVADLGQAMAAMLDGVRRRLAVAGHGDVAFEFRQPYVSPAIARHGEILRANDCPADSVVNRAASVDARIISVGQVVHADPMMWGLAGGALAVAQQLYAGWFAVPQISMRLSELSAEQTDALRGLLSLWRDQSATTLDGTLDACGAERGYDLVRAVHTGLDRSVIVRYAPVAIDLDEDATTETIVINATADPRLILRLARPIASGVIRSAAAERQASVDPCEPGLVEITVPPFGSITLLTNCS